jgi:Spy/CpxP family protein refolding chaperone
MVMQDATRLRLSASGLLVLVFGAGVLIGLVLERGVTPASGATVVPSPPAAAAPSVPLTEVAVPAEPPVARGYVIDEVSMDPAVRAQVEEILDTYRGRVVEAAERHRQEYSSLAADARESFRALLSDPQRAEYDSLLQVRREERDRDPNRGPGRR